MLSLTDRPFALFAALSKFLNGNLGITLMIDRIWRRLLCVWCKRKWQNQSERSFPPHSLTWSQSYWGCSVVLPERAGRSRSAGTVYLWPALPLRFVGMGGDRGWRWVILSSSPLDFAKKNRLKKNKTKAIRRTRYWPTNLQNSPVCRSPTVLRWRIFAVFALIVLCPFVFQLKEKEK